MSACIFLPPVSMETMGGQNTNTIQGPYLNDVCTEGGGGSPKSRQSKEGCVNYIA